MKTTTQDDHYTYRLTWSAEDGEFVGLCAEFPSLSWLDVSQQKALTGIQELVKSQVADMTSANEPLPEALADRHYSGVFRTRIPSSLHRALAVEAAEEGISLNRLISTKLAQ